MKKNSVIDIIRKRKMCDRKRSYVDKNSAENSRLQVEKKFNESMRSYECPHCHMWHLTRNKDQSL